MKLKGSLEKAHYIHQVSTRIYFTFFIRTAAILTESYILDTLAAKLHS